MKKLLCLFLAISLLLLCACEKRPEYDNRRDDDEDETEETSEPEENHAMDNHIISAIEMNYYYFDTAFAIYSNVSQQASGYESVMLSAMGLDPKLPMNQQVETSSNKIWSDYLTEMALQEAQRDYALCQAAKEAGFELDEADRYVLEQVENNLDINAKLQGFDDGNALLQSWYTEVASIETYLAYYEKTFIADRYYEYYKKSLQYFDEAIAAADIDPIVYNAYSFSYYHLDSTSLLHVEQDDFSLTDHYGENAYDLNPEEIARKEAERIATALTSCESYDELQAAIGKIKLSNGYTPHLNNNTGMLYSHIQAIYKDWLTSPERVPGDIQCFANEVTETDADGKEVNVIKGYYIVYFKEMNDNNDKMSNVRHLLIETGEDADAARVMAQQLLEQYYAGAKTEESFVDLVKNYTEDQGSAETGGLYEDIHYGSPYVQAFLAWAIHPNRMSGDVDIIQTEYGFHIMYFVGHSTYSYREQMIIDKLRNEAVNTWYEQIIEQSPTVTGNTEHLPFDKSFNDLMGFDVTSYDSSY